MDNSTITELLNSGVKFRDPVTFEVRRIVQVINYVILAGIISLFGVGANIVNISVFVRQGLKDSINISLMGLAISDLLCLLTLLWMSNLYNPLVYKLELPIEYTEVNYATGGWPHVGLSRITGAITAFITLERCLCIAMPLKVKNIITPFRTKVIIVSIFVSIIAVFCPFFFVNKLEWKYSLSRNRSVFGITYTGDRELVDSITNFIHSVFLSSVLLLNVIICTIILVVKLNKKTKWREESVAQVASKPETISVKEKKVIKMVILISTIFIVCYLPTTVIVMAMVFYSEFCVGGRYENLLYVIWSGPLVLNAINSSVNIFVYFNMSTKYRVAFREMFRGLSKPAQASKRMDMN